MMHGPANARKI